MPPLRDGEDEPRALLLDLGSCSPALQLWPEALSSQPWLLPPSNGVGVLMWGWRATYSAQGHVPGSQTQMKLADRGEGA